MEFVLITRSKEDLFQQFRLIKRVENFTYRKKYQKQVLFFACLSFFFLFLFFFTNTSIFVTAKAVLFGIFAIAWVIGICFCIWFAIRRQKINAWIRHTVKSDIDSNKNHYVRFDELGLTHKTDEVSTDFKWSYFVAYLENADYLLLFPVGSIYSSVSFSIFEIGKDNMERLKKIVKEKVRVLYPDLKLY